MKPQNKHSTWLWQLSSAGVLGLLVFASFSSFAQTPPAGLIHQALCARLLGTQEGPEVLRTPTVQLSPEDVAKRHEHLDLIFETAFFEPEIYCDLGTCAENVTRLFLDFARETPGLEMGEFRVLIILSENALPPAKAGETSLAGAESFEAQRARVQMRPHPAEGPMQRSWGYHVVLEHVGRIYDLDFTNGPSPQMKSEYFRWMFPSGFFERSDLRVVAVPGEVYLQWPEREIGKTSTLSSLIAAWPAVSFEELLQRPLIEDQASGNSVP